MRADGPFGRVSTESVLAQFGRYQAERVCECPACLAAGVTTPPVAVPAGADTDGRGRFVRMALWLHGQALVEHEDAAAAYGDALASFKERSIS